MSKKFRVVKNKTKWGIKAKFLVLAVVIAGESLWLPYKQTAQAESCPDLKIIFARGSGAVRWENNDYKEFKARIDEKLKATGLDYEFLDLDYPAVEVGLGNIGTSIGALIGAGDAYAFGESINTGLRELKKTVGACTNTKYVLGGYSQGAMVVSKALPDLDADKIIYVATFGDPKIYLPEGKGIIPAACRGENLSDYRVYVPDCQAYKGLLGAYIPYEPTTYAGKVGTWCNKRDIFCSSHINISDHLGYVSDNLYEDASRVVASKVTQAFGIKNEYTSPHNTAILIDSTGSMAWLIDQFKDEAIRLANETFEAGGRVALYDYRDLRDPYEPVARCDFETCTVDNFRAYLDEIVVDGGGDEPESMLSASIKVMNELKWRQGATKSLVVLTDAPFLSPDIDATTVEDVTELSKKIDPVNMYIITEEANAIEHPEMAELSEETGGKLTTELGALNLLTNFIMERYDSLPRVEEIVDDGEAPTVNILESNDEGNLMTIKLSGDMTGAIIILNEAVLGITTENNIVISGLDRSMINNLSIVPINEDHKGMPTEIEIPIISGWVKERSTQTKELASAAEIGNISKTPSTLIETRSDDSEFDNAMENNGLIIPRAPDTGIIK